MAVETSAELLGRVSLFEGLTQEQLTAVANKGKKTFFEAGAAIVSEGAEGDAAYLILSGRAVTVPGPDSVLEPVTMEAGALVGEMAALAETVHNVTINAQERVRALAISRADLFAVMEADIEIAQFLSDKLLDRLAVLAQDLRIVDAQFAALEMTLDQAISAVAA